jgi:hypothetical protein
VSALFEYPIPATPCWGAGEVTRLLSFCAERLGVESVRLVNVPHR